MKHFCELKFNQAAALGPFVIFCHGQRGIAEPTKQCCNWKAPDFYSHVPPPPACPTDSTREVIKALYQDRGLVKIRSPPSAKQCVVKGLGFCSTSWRSGWLRPVKAAPRLSGICQPFSEEPAVQQWSGTPDTTLLAFPGALPWGKGDRRRMPRHSSVGDQLSRLRIFVLLVLAQQAPSWSRTPGAGAFGRNMQVLLCLAQQILKVFVSLCEPCGQAQHGYTSSMMSGGAGSCSALLYPLHEFCPLAAPFPAGCRACTLAFPIGSILRLNFASAPGQTSTKSASLSLCVGIMQSRAVRKLRLDCAEQH